MKKVKTSFEERFYPGQRSTSSLFIVSIEKRELDEGQTGYFNFVLRKENGLSREGVELPISFVFEYAVVQTNAYDDKNFCLPSNLEEKRFFLTESKSQNFPIAGPLEEHKGLP